MNERIAKSIVQIAIDAGFEILTRLCRKNGRKLPIPEEVINYAVKN